MFCPSLQFLAELQPNALRLLVARAAKPTPPRNQVSDRPYRAAAILDEHLPLRSGRWLTARTVVLERLLSLGCPLLILMLR